MNITPETQKLIKKYAKKVVRWIWNNTNADDIIIDDINLSLIQVGG